MDDRRSIFTFFSRTFCCYGVTICIMIVLCKVFGESAKEKSTMFNLGSEGLSVNMLFQFFMVILIINIIEYILFSERLFKKMSLPLRTAIMMVISFAAVVAFILIFDWFRADLLVSWVMFIISYIFTVVIAILLTAWKEKMENKQMEEGLERLKKQWENEEHEKHNS